MSHFMLKCSVRPVSASILTCSEDLLIQTADGDHGDRNVFEETNQAQVAKVLQFDTLLVSLRHSLTFEYFVQNLQTHQEIVS